MAGEEALAHIQKIFAAIVWLFLLANHGTGQVARDTGAIAGQIADKLGKPIAGAHVLVRTGDQVVRTIDAETDGTFTIALLPPGSYELQVDAGTSASGSISTGSSLTPVEVRVGETSPVLVEISRGPTAFQVTVTASPLPIDFHQTQLATSIGLKTIDGLPINRRTFLDFSLLLPGVSDATWIADQADFRPPLTPASGLSFSGNNGRGNSFAIDGISINGASGNVRPSIPQSAVQEFQINRAGYSAELGGATGGVVNIVSRSGGDQWHGSIFGFLRHRDLQARNFFDPGDSPYTRVQSGVSISGPLRRNRTFIYGALERLDRHENAFVTILRDPSILDRVTPTQDALIRFLAGTGDPRLAQIAGLLRTVLTPSNHAGVSELFRENSGSFPFSAQWHQASVRLDEVTNHNHRMFLRLNFSKTREENARLGALIGYSNGNAAKWLDGTAVVGYTWTPNGRWALDSRAAIGYSRLRMIPNDAMGPELVISGFGQFGRNGLYPLDQKERYLQFQQSFQYTNARHALRFGVDLSPTYNSSDIQTFFSGRFIFGEYIPLSGLLDGAAGDPTLSAGLGAFLNASGQSNLVSALTAPISSLQAYSLGLPIAYAQGFGSSKYTAWRQNYSAFVQDSWRAWPGLVLNLGARFQADVPNAIRSVQYVEPRVGFAYAPWKSSTTVIRGGFGIYHDWVMSPIPFGQVQVNRPDVALVFLPLTGIPGIVNPATGLPLTSADVYQSFAMRGISGVRTAQLSDLTSLGLPDNFRSPTAGGVESDYTSPYSEQFYFEVEHSIASATVSAGYEFRRTAHAWRVRDHNLVVVGTQPNGWPMFGRANPALGNIYVYESAANAFYGAMVLRAERRFSRRWSFNAQYTLSRALDEVTDFNFEYAPHNQMDARADRGLSLFHQKHRFTFSGIYESPHAASCRAAGWSCLLSDWTLASIVTVNSARPFNVLTGVDNLGDGAVTNHRPLGLGRNTGIGPDYASADMRIARTFRMMSERVRVRMTMEGFNIFNRTNFESVNNITGDVPLSVLPSRIVASVGNPTVPFSYTSARPARQLQAGLAVEF
jgi:hypothetical protein